MPGDSYLLGIAPKVRVINSNLRKAGPSCESDQRPVLVQPRPVLSSRAYGRGTVGPWRAGPRDKASAGAQRPEYFSEGISRIRQPRKHARHECTRKPFVRERKRSCIPVPKLEVSRSQRTGVLLRGHPQHVRAVVDAGSCASRRKGPLQERPTAASHFEEHVALPERQTIEDGLEAGEMVHGLLPERLACWAGGSPTPTVVGPFRQSRGSGREEQRRNHLRRYPPQFVLLSWLSSRPDSTRMLDDDRGPPSVGLASDAKSRRGFRTGAVLGPDEFRFVRWIPPFQAPATLSRGLFFRAPKLPAGFRVYPPPSSK